MIWNFFHRFKLLPGLQRQACQGNPHSYEKHCNAFPTWTTRLFLAKTSIPLPHRDGRPLKWYLSTVYLGVVLSLSLHIWIELMTLFKSSCVSPSRNINQLIKMVMTHFMSHNVYYPLLIDLRHVMCVVYLYPSTLLVTSAFEAVLSPAQGRHPTCKLQNAHKMRPYGHGLVHENL